MRQCSVCRESKGKEAFSGRQWSAQARVRKCRACSDQAVPPCATQAAGAPEAGAPEACAPEACQQAGTPAGLPPLLRGHVADSHVPGMLVRVKGLVKTHEHNGKLATILPAKAPAGRVAIAMKDGKELSVKQENIDAVCLNCLSAGVSAVCGKCKTAAFCSPACQASIWRKHMNECGDGRLARADCQKTLKPSETVFFLSRCDGVAAFYLSALHRESKTGGTVFAQLVIGMKRGIRGATYETSPHFRPWKSAADMKDWLERLETFGSSKDVGGSASGTLREVHRRICSALAAALARRAEAETIQLDRRALYADSDILKALDVFRRRGSADSSEAAGDDALLADPLLGSREAGQLKELMSSQLLSGYQCGVRVVQLLQGENQGYLDWIGVIYNMLHCRGEYRYEYSFVDVARMGRWQASWLPQGTSDAQKVEAVLLGMHKDPSCSVSVARVAPMMRHMSLWHSLGGEENLSAMTLLAAEDAEACWYNSAIVVGMMISAAPERFQRHVEFSFGHFRERLHKEFLPTWCALSVASCGELRDLADEICKEKREKKRQLQLQEQAAAAGPNEANARTFVDKNSGRKLTMGSGFSENFSQKEMEEFKSHMAGMGFEIERAAQPQSDQTASVSGQHVTGHLFCAADLEDLCHETGFSSSMELMVFCTHVNNRRQRTEGSGNELDFASIVRSALPLWFAMLSSDACEDPLDALEAQVRLKHPPAGLRRQLADVYLWGLALKEDAVKEGREKVESARERHQRGWALLQEAIDVEEDCEAMGAWADHNLVTLAREFNPHRRSEIWFGNAHLPPLTQAVKENQYFQSCIKCLGRAAAKGFVSPMLLHLGYQTFAEPTILHGIEGGAEITAVLAQDAALLKTNVRANVLAREDSVRKIASEEGLRGADRLRLLGNDFFKEKMYKASRTEYSKALDVVALALEQRAGAGDLDQISRETRVKCLANRAECNLKLANFSYALTDVLSARKENWEDMPPELADKLHLREERARMGLQTQVQGRDSGSAAASSSSSALGQVSSGQKSRLADASLPPMATAAGIRAAKDQESERGLDADATEQARLAEGGKEVAVGSSAGADGHEGRQEEEADVCCVCLEEPSARKQCVKLSCCAYLIHAECMEEWKEQCEVKKFPTSCPACQQLYHRDVGMDLFLSKFGPLV